MMRSFFSLQWLLLLVGCSASGLLNIDDTDSNRLTELGELPAELAESSGLEWADTDLLWSHNDHKNGATLYAIDLKGNLVKTVNLPVTNEDWEDLTVDTEDNLYIGDFGNNDNERQDLRIYRVAAGLLTKYNNEIRVDTIRFSFPEQVAFPPIETERYFDVEAMLATAEQLYLFTRDRSKPFGGKTRIYRLPTTAGDYEATFITELTTAPSKNDGQITAADISPDGKTVALLSNRKIWLLEDVQFPDFQIKRVQEINIPIKRQMEGIVFKDDCVLYLTNESKKDEVGQLFRLVVCAQ